MYLFHKTLSLRALFLSRSRSLKKIEYLQETNRTLEQKVEGLQQKKKTFSSEVADLSAKNQELCSELTQIDQLAQQLERDKEMVLETADMELQEARVWKPLTCCFKIKLEFIHL